MRTKYPKSILRFHTKAQQEQWDRYIHLAAISDPHHQRIVFTGQDKKSGVIHFDNFYIRTGLVSGLTRCWVGYKFSIMRDGTVVRDKSWRTYRKLDGSLILVKPEPKSHTNQLFI